MNDIQTSADFNFSYAPGVTYEQTLGFEMAGEFWSQYLTDNVSVNIHVEISDRLPENVMGGAIPAIESNVLYKDYRHNLKRDVVSDIDRSVRRNQQDETDKFTAFFTSQYENDGYKVDNNEYMQMTRSNAKALDLIDPVSNDLDGYVVMRDLDGFGDGSLNDVSWSYDYLGDTVASDSLDFLSVAIHEVGHILGFISGVDQSGWLAERNNLNEGNEDDYYSDLVGNLNNATPLDMIRFSDASYQASGDGENWIDMSVGGNPYLSFTGSGGEAVAYFSTGSNTSLGGDGYQASHWKQQANAVGIMDPVIAKGQKRETSELDLQSFDAIGWDVDYDRSSDIQVLYDRALSDANSALVSDRNDELAEIIDNEIYEGRRSYSYWMNAGYFSTFSKPVADVVESAEGNTLIINNAEKKSKDHSIDTYETSEESEASVSKSVDKVATNYLEIDRSNSESALLKEITESLNTGLETAIATQTL